MELRLLPNLKMGRLSWVIWVGPIPSQASSYINKGGRKVKVRITRHEKDLTSQCWLLR